MTKISVYGAKGRMGQRIVALIGDDSACDLGAALDQGDDISAGVAASDVVIDFSIADATVPLIELCAAQKKGAVIGTTGHTDEQEAAIKELSNQIPIVKAPNMSIGVNVMWKIISEAAKALGDSFPVQVSETHHIHKKDKPSGTALEIGRVLSESLGVHLDEIPIESFREGEVVGDHITLFAGTGEALEITHHAASRDIFALGAIRGAKWVADKKPGLYSMQDVLGLTIS